MDGQGRGGRNIKLAQSDNRHNLECATIIELC